MPPKKKGTAITTAPPTPLRQSQRRSARPVGTAANDPPKICQPPKIRRRDTRKSKLRTETTTSTITTELPPSDSVAKITATTSPSSNIVATSTETPTHNIASGLGGSEFVPTPAKLLSGKELLKSVQEEKSNLSDDDNKDSEEDLVAEEKSNLSDDDNKDCEEDLGAENFLMSVEEEKSDLSDDNYKDSEEDSGAEDDFFSSAAFLETVSVIREDDHSPNLLSSNKTTHRDPPPRKPTQEELNIMTEDEAAAAIAQYRVLCKKWTDAKLRQRRYNTSLGSLVEYTGDMTPSLRLMSEVEVRRLNARDSFENKEVLRMRIAEEANLRGVWITTLRSNTCVLLVVGDNFYVKANNTERNGWVVNLLSG